MKMYADRIKRDVVQWLVARSVEGVGQKSGLPDYLQADSPGKVGTVS